MHAAGGVASVPAGHVAAVKAHVGAPATLYAPAAQRVQVALEAAPAMALAVPAGQAVQEEAPLPPYVPAAHAVQAELEEAPAALKVPAGQGKGAMELKGQKEPAGHSWGVPLPHT
jgi:hypothetical protein